MSNHVDRDKTKLVAGHLGVKTVILNQNPVHRVDTGQKIFLVFKINFSVIKIDF
jgi:hypothetical protein